MMKQKAPPARARGAFALQAEPAEDQSHADLEVKLQPKRPFGLTGFEKQRCIHKELLYLWAKSLVNRVSPARLFEGVSSLHSQVAPSCAAVRR